MKFSLNFFAAPKRQTYGRNDVLKMPVKNGRARPRWRKNITIRTIIIRVFLISIHLIETCTHLDAITMRFLIVFVVTKNNNNNTTHSVRTQRERLSILLFNFFFRIFFGSYIKTRPYYVLYPQQDDDVVVAEKRFFHTGYDYCENTFSAHYHTTQFARHFSNA